MTKELEWKTRQQRINTKLKLNRVFLSLTSRRMMSPLR
jgi:hypothetical protein